MNSHVLSLLIFLPLVALVILLFVPSTQYRILKGGNILVATMQLIVAIYLYNQFTGRLNGITETSGFEFVERTDWINLSLGNIGKLSIDYFLGVDGLSISLVLLSALVLWVGAISSWTITQKVKGYILLYLLLSTSIMGCFLALDFFLFFLFFEFMLLPMYFLIGIWGGERREYAAIKFFIYTLIGSVCILVVMIGLYLSVTENKEVHTFSILAMTQAENFVSGSLLHPSSTSLVLGMPVRYLAFLLLFIGFAIKLPAVPVHTWLPDAHVEAPTSISVVLAGILLKIGAYGLIRIAYPVFPEAAEYYSFLIGGLGVLAILYGAMNAMAAADMKRMVAYSSVSHMGFVLLGLASLTVEGVSGAVYQLFSHGILSALLFLLVGVLYDRTHDKTILYYRGLASPMPTYTAAVTIAFFASLGLPGFSGFIGEFFTLMGAFGTEKYPSWMGFGGALGLILGAAYFLWTLQRMFFGGFWTKGGETWRVHLTDLNLREKVLLTSLAVLSLVFGLFPNLLFGKMETTMNHFVDWMVK